MSGEVRVWQVDAASMPAVRPRLAELLVDSVESGASVGFLAPLRQEVADAYWERIERAVSVGKCLLLVAALGDGPIVGTIHLDVDTFPNQRHRGTVCKLLVHSSARRRGVGTALVQGLERAAAAAGRWMLTLDTATGSDAERLYRRLGWNPAGVLPRYAQNPDGSLTHTSLYWKDLMLAPPEAPRASPASGARDG